MKKVNSFNLKKYALLLFILTLIVAQPACVPLMIKKSFEKKQSSDTAPKSHPAQLTIAFDKQSEMGKIKKESYELLMAKNFSELEKSVDEAREKKLRLIGGYWKLDSIYDSMSEMYSEHPGAEVTDEMWKDRIELLKQWKTSSPDSISPRIGLAEAYIGYGWYVRGYGFANTVSPENYNLLYERLDLAANELTEAGKLKVKCQRWYRDELFLMMTGGLPLDNFDQIYDEAISFEPNYLQPYLTKSENITPKWHGKPGEWQKFVDDLPGKLEARGNNDADLIYLIVIGNKIEDKSVKIDFKQLDNARLKKGFVDLEKKYGIDKVRLNHFIHLMDMMGDSDAIKAALDMYEKQERSSAS